MGVKGYKAFNKGMICKGKQYEENATYEENGNEICEAGVMHFCENPFDVLNYYPLVDENGGISDFADVEAIGDIYKEKDKTATNKLHIGAKLGLKGFIKACVDFTIEKTRVESGKDNETDSSGYYAQIGSSGYCAQIGSSGDYAQIGSSGDCAKIGSSGYYAKIGSSGDCAKIGSSGDYAKIGSSGDCAQIGSSGDYAKITSEGKNSVVMAAGCNSIAKAKIGSWITLVEWIRTDKTDDSGNCIWIPKCVKTEYVDGERIKEDIFYKLVDGEFKEVESEE
nr:MAG TPA: hypothetical protein [Bacteriophage sp.]